MIFYFSAPRNVFLYGRGGSKATHCSWMIHGKPEDAVRIRIHSLKADRSTCKSAVRPLTENLDCEDGSLPLIKLHVSEVPWRDVEIPRACLCSTEVLPHVIESRGSALLLNLTLSGMGPGDDYRNLNFEVEYEFLSKDKCPDGNRRLESSAGGIMLSSAESPDECDTRPWLLEAPMGHSFFLTVPKATFANSSCSTDSRLILRQPGRAESLVVACPAADQDSSIKFVWPPIPGLHQPVNRAAFHNFMSGAPQLVAQYKSQRSSALSIQWLHLRDPNKIEIDNSSSSANYEDIHSRATCRELCVVLRACIAQELWCDGVTHCPDGKDQLHFSKNAN